MYFKGEGDTKLTKDGLLIKGKFYNDDDEEIEEAEIELLNETPESKLESFLNALETAKNRE